MKRILFSILLFIYAVTTAQDKKITIEDLWQKFTFMSDGFYGISTLRNDSQYVDIDEGKDGQKLVVYDLLTEKEVRVLADSKDLVLPDSKKPVISLHSFTLSDDEQKILVYGEQEPVYRHSTRENYYVYDLGSKKLSPVSTKGKQSLASFSPGGSHVAFVRENNLYVMDVAGGKEVQVTHDGTINKIINGATDWVYEEEFSFDKGYAWSPDGKRIAYYRFDESEVKEFNFQKYGSLYPNDYRYKYPKAGEKNAVVTIHVYDLATGKSRMVQTGPEKDQYIPRIKWTADPNVLCVTRMNRLQNKLELLLADCTPPSETLPVKLLMSEQSKTYIEIHDHLEFLAGNKEFIWMSDKDGWNHLYHFSMEGKQLAELTQGNYDVTEYYGFNEKSGELYFAAAATHPTEQEVYSRNIITGVPKKLSLKKGVSNAVFSADYAYYVISHSDANTPPSADLFSADGKLIRQMMNNDELVKKMSNYKLSRKTFFSFRNDAGIELNGWMILPVDFDQKKKYPVFMTVYGGPGANTVENQWGGNDYFWHQMLAQKGYIVVSVDNRGTGNRGREFKHCTYRQLGKLETEDQISAAKYLGSLPYVDKERIGIFGWSYGGYMSSLCISKGAAYFKAAIAVAPVTNWRYYDSIYTERYNGLPQDNPSGYDDNSPINHVSKIKGKYLLIHGTADDNVHFQNAVEMNAALIKANVQFESMYYPDKNHGIYGGNSRLHLYNLMTTFLDKNL